MRAQRLHDRRPDGEVGHEVPVHHVDVEEVGLVGHAVDVAPERREVGRQDRRGDLHPANVPPRQRSARCNDSTNIPSVPAVCGRSRAPRPTGVQAAPGGGTARRSASCAAQLVDADRLRVGERAHRVHEPAAVAHERGRRRQDRLLELHELVDGGGRDPPPGVGTRRSTPRPLHGASTRTRSARGGERRASGVGDGHVHRREREARRCRATSRAARVDVERINEPARADVARRARLSAGRGGDVDEHRSPAADEQRDDRLARLVLGVAAFAKRRKPRWVADPAHEGSGTSARVTSIASVRSSA